MTCPHCRSSATSQRRHRTELGYRRFRCRSCGRRFNERTGSGFNELHYPTDIVLLTVLWRLRYKLGSRDVAELLLERGYEVTHETIRGWEARFAPLLEERLRTMRRGQASRSWYIDETYVKVAGRCCYLYRAIDRYGQTPPHGQAVPARSSGANVLEKSLPYTWELERATERQTIQTFVRAWFVETRVGEADNGRMSRKLVLAHDKRDGFAITNADPPGSALVDSQLHSAPR